jgi:hypothetical protein
MARLKETQPAETRLDLAKPRKCRCKFGLEIAGRDRTAWLGRDDGYFRCADDLLWEIGLFWSNTVRPMLDEKDFLPVSRAAELLALIESHPLTNERLASGLSTKALNRQRELLMTLLRRSIELREPLEVIVFEGGPPNA